MDTPRKKASAGRPPKFEEASSPVTVTLPHRTLRALERIDRDRAKAIVKCVEAMAPDAPGAAIPVEIVKVCEGSGLIVIGPSRSLAQIPGLRLVEIAPQRFLLAISEGCSPTVLELTIMDIIEHLLPEEIEEKALLSELRHHLSLHRRKESMTTGEILFVDM